MKSSMLVGDLRRVEAMRFKVKGMTCGHCVKTVAEAVERAIPGAKVSVDLATGIVGVEATDQSTRDRVKSAIERSGYTVADEVL